MQTLGLFHNSINHRRRNNIIRRLKDAKGNCVEDKRELGVLISHYFQQIFKSNYGNLGIVL